MKNAKASEVVAGTILYPDGDFTCMRANEPHEVRVGSSGNLYVECDAGEHSLEGQLSDNTWDEYMGLSLTPWTQVPNGMSQKGDEE